MPTNKPQIITKQRSSVLSANACVSSPVMSWRNRRMPYNGIRSPRFFRCSDHRRHRNCDCLSADPTMLRKTVPATSWDPDSMRNMVSLQNGHAS